MRLMETMPIDEIPEPQEIIRMIEEENRRNMTGEKGRAEAQITLIREILGLGSLHDPVEAVRVLYDRGNAAFEAARGPHASLHGGVPGLAGGYLGSAINQQAIVTCRGSLALGTGCGHCQKCLKERAMMAEYKARA